MKRKKLYKRLITLFKDNERPTKESTEKFIELSTRNFQVFKEVISFVDCLNRTSAPFKFFTETHIMARTQEFSGTKYERYFDRACNSINEFQKDVVQHRKDVRAKIQEYGFTDIAKEIIGT